MFLGSKRNTLVLPSLYQYTVGVVEGEGVESREYVLEEGEFITEISAHYSKEYIQLQHLFEVSFRIKTFYVLFDILIYIFFLS